MKRVAFLLSSAHVGGGTYVIFQHALFLTRAGHQVTIVTEQGVEPDTVSWHPEAARELSFKTLAEAQAITFDIAVATWWRTVFRLSELRADSYVYFVQSIESRFYPAIDAAARRFVESTYCLGLPVITEAQWIKSYLEEHFSATVDVATNGIRKDLYTAEGSALSARKDGSLRVLVEGPLGVFFKNTERTIELCSQSKADEIWFLTSSPGCVEYPWVDRIFSCVPITETPAIYRSCDVLVKLSYVEGMFGPPLEIFHCGGTAIVYDVSGHDEYIENGRNAVVIKRDREEEVIQTINRLKDDPRLLRTLKEGAVTTSAAWPDWSDASRVFMDKLLQVAPADPSMRGKLRAAERLFAEWHCDHAKCQAEVARLEQVRRECEQLAEALRAEIQGRQHQIDKIVSSRSFRVMQFLRSVLGVSYFKAAFRYLVG